MLVKGRGEASGPYDLHISLEADNSAQYCLVDIDRCVGPGRMLNSMSKSGQLLKCS